MFFGEFRHSLDSKGRLTLPVSFRDAFADGLFITRGLDGCLSVYTRQNWSAELERLSGLNEMQADSRKFQRTLFSGVKEETLDNQGRIQLPQNLIDHARLEKEAIIIGVATHIEIWSKDNWAGYSETAHDSFEEIAEKLYRDRQS